MTKFPLFRLDSVYNTNASEAKQMLERNSLYQIMGLRIPTGQRQTSRLFTSLVEDLNLTLPKTNPVTGQGHPTTVSS